MTPASGLKVEVMDTAEAVAKKAAAIIAEEARAAVDAHGRFVMAVSGGKTPWVMLRALSAIDLPWRAAHIVQVDERVAPSGHPDRNLTHLQESLLSAAQIHEMPVDWTDLGTAAAAYAATLLQLAGRLRSWIWSIWALVLMATPLRLYRATRFLLSKTRTSQSQVSIREGAV